LLEFDSDQISVDGCELRGKILENQWFDEIKSRCSTLYLPLSFAPTRPINLLSDYCNMLSWTVNQLEVI